MLVVYKYESHPKKIFFVFFSSSNNQTRKMFEGKIHTHNHGYISLLLLYIIILIIINNSLYPFTKYLHQDTMCFFQGREEGEKTENGVQKTHQSRTENTHGGQLAFFPFFLPSLMPFFSSIALWYPFFEMTKIVFLKKHIGRVTEKKKLCTDKISRHFSFDSKKKRGKNNK